MNLQGQGVNQYYNREKVTFVYMNSAITSINNVSTLNMLNKSIKKNLNLLKKHNQKRQTLVLPFFSTVSQAF